MSSDNKLQVEKVSELISTLKSRFEENKTRHEKIAWQSVLKRIENNHLKLWSLNEMERTGGEPDVVGMDLKTGEFIFVDCSDESPSGRRSLCYDQKGLESRKDIQPVDSAVGMAEKMGIEILDEFEYHELQKLGKYDTRSSSWINTPATIRKLGGAIFGDFRYDRVFIYHNGAQSFYNSRGFRASLKV